jgi:lycopene beta-cyclase
MVRRGSGVQSPERALGASARRGARHRHNDPVVPPAPPSAPSYLILGAGLAGLSLADALLRRGVQAPITVADARERFDNDRTWCFWDVHPHPYRDLISHRWSQWSFEAPGTAHRQSSTGAPYCHLPADRFYADVLARLEAAPNCELVLGTTIGEAAERDGAVAVSTSAGELSGSHVFDALATGGPTWSTAAPALGPGVLCQRFLGQFVETDEPAFDPTCVRLMDFDVTPNGELHFMYLLPFSATSALVEDTTIGPVGTADADRRAEIARYLQERHGLAAWRVVREEASAIPMLGVGAPRRQSSRLIPVGTAAGAVRPSSGYAFVRTQRQVAALADRVVAGRPSAPRIGRRRDAFLDRVFLEVLQADPAAFSPNFLRLGRHLAGDRLARFMMDAATPLDHFLLIAALPKPPFLLGAARAGRKRLAA